MQLPATLFAAALICTGSIAAEPRARGEVATIEVRLFLTHTGTFSDPVPEGATLWNVVTGEAGLGEPSSSTFVKVKILGKPKTYAEGQVVELRVFHEGPAKSTTRQRAQLGLFDSEGKQYVGFWLSNTGCTSLLLAASVIGSGQSVQQRIPFRCGE